MNPDVKFKHILPIQIRFNDVDAQGHVNNTIYFTFYDLGKTTYFQDVMAYGLEAMKVGAVIAHAEVDFLSPLKGHEPVAVQTAVSEVGNKSFQLIQRLINSETKEVKCICSSVMVAFDIATQKAVEIPSEWKEAFCVYEGRDLRRKKAVAQ